MLLYRDDTKVTFASERKFIVFERQLLALFRICRYVMINIVEHIQ